MILFSIKFFCFCQLVAPKKKRLIEAQALLADQMENLSQKRSELKGVMEKLEILNNDYEAKVNKKEVGSSMLLQGSIP